MSVNVLVCKKPHNSFHDGGQLLACHCLNGKAYAGPDILVTQGGIIVTRYFIEGQPVLQQFKDIRHPYPRA